MSEDNKYNHTGYKVDKDNFSWLYEVVERNAKVIGIDIESEGIEVRLIGDSDVPNLKDLKNNANMNSAGKTMFIGTDFLTKLSKTAKNSDNFYSVLGGIIKHELQHYVDHKNRLYYYRDALEMIPDIISGEYSRKMKVLECRADFVNAGNRDFIEFLKNSDPLNIDTYVLHTSSNDRIRSLMIQSYIKEHTKSESNPDGITLTPNDVEFNEKGEFSITNKEKLHAIPAEVLIAAYNEAERSIPKYINSNVPEEEGRVDGFSMPSVPLKPKSQELDRRKGVGP